MKGDFTRLTFDRPDPATTRVLMQQGRVQLDSDWNEQQAVNEGQRRALALASLGAEATPNAGGGFAVGATATGKDLTISPGTLVVDGLRCVNPAPATLLGQPFLPAADGSGPGIAPPAADGRYLVYLDAWERHVPALLDPSIREVALGGPDTATRARVVWQVRLARLASPETTEDALLDGDWLPSDAVSTGAMGAQADPGAAPSGPCVLPPQAGYRALFNQLYRVEIHRGGTVDTTLPPAAGGPTFKWSRDNGTVVTRVLTPVAAGLTLQVADLGADEVLGFAPGQWVELVDERMELSDGHGALLLVAAVNADTRTITLDPSTPVAAGTWGTVLLRRWDQAGAGATAQGLPVAAGPIPLEAGLSVSFASGTYRAGDYWTVPARTAISSDSGTIIWPGAPGSKLPPEGVRHHVAALALVDYAASSGVFTPVEDCRRLFDPLVGRLPPLRVRMGGVNGAALLPGQAVPVDALTGTGLTVATRVSLDPASVSTASVQLQAEAPVLMSALGGKPGDARVAGTQLVSLAAQVTPVAANAFTVAPSPAAADLLSSLLASGTGGDAGDVLRSFHAADLGAPTAWAAQPGGTLGVARNVSGNALFAGIAVSQTTIEAPVDHLGTVVAMTGLAGGTQGGEATVGLVFNWVSDTDFWVFYYFMQNNFEFGQPTFGLAHMVGGAPVASPLTAGTSMIDRDAQQVSLDITSTGSSLAFNAQVRWLSDGSVTNHPNLFPPPPPPPPGSVRPTGPLLTAPLAQAVASQIPAVLKGAAVQPTELLKPGAAGLRLTSDLAGTTVGATRPRVVVTTSTPTPAATPASNAPPTSILPGTRAGVAVNKSGTAVFTNLSWTSTAGQTTAVLPLGRALVRLVVRRSLIRTQAEAAAAASGGLPATVSPEPDFQTYLWVTPPRAGYGSGSGAGSGRSGTAGIGAGRM